MFLRCSSSFLRRQSVSMMFYTTLPYSPFLSTSSYTCRSFSSANSPIVKLNLEEQKISIGPKKINEDNLQIEVSNLMLNTSSRDRISKTGGTIDIESILEFSVSKKIHLKEACELIHKIGETIGKSNKIQELHKLEKDPRFSQLLNQLSEGTYVPIPNSLLMALHGLKLIGFTPDSKIVLDLENELKWVMRRCQVRFLFRIVNFYMESPKNGLLSSNIEIKQKEEVNFPVTSPIQNVLNTIGKRWVEVTSGKDFIAAFKIMNYLPAEVREKLEDRAVENVEDFTVNEMIKMIIVLATQKRRPTPLLRSLAFHISKSTEVIFVGDLIELVHALNSLTFADPVLMDKLCNNLIEEVPKIKAPSLVSLLLTSLGQMRYKNEKLMNLLSEWLTAHISEVRPFELAAWLLASSVTNSNISQYSDLVSKVKTSLSHESTKNSIEWLNIVHALAVMNQLSSDLVSSVLHPDFIKKISESKSLTNWKVKLLNLNYIGQKSEKFGLGKYKGPTLPKEIVREWTETLAPSDPKLSELVIETLKNFLPSPKYLATCNKTFSGVFIDGLCQINKSNSCPLPLLVPSNELSKNTSKKIAILALGYPALTIGHKVPVGNSALQIRLLESEGYSVIPVPYTEFNSKEKVLLRVQYLESRIKGDDLGASIKT